VIFTQSRRIDEIPVIDPESTPIPEWAVVALDGIDFGKAFCWAQPEQDLE
jgi:hypothetical protein